MKIRAIGSVGSHVRKAAVAVWDWIPSFLWPSQCGVCRTVMEADGSFLCQLCWQQLSHSLGHHYCRRCGRAVSPYGLLPDGCGHCNQEKLHFDGIIRVGQYESVLRQMILSLKFHEATETIGLLGRLLRTVFDVQSKPQTYDFLVPVPLHWRRRLERGFNQSLLLARQICGSQISISQDLVRIPYTRRQWNLTGPQRRRNVRGAFAVRKDHPFSGKTVCLVDDITTSGATLNECAKTLKRAGANKVCVIVLAVAESIS